MTRVRRFAGSGLVAATAAIGLALLVVGPVAAECDGPIPPFRDWAATARRVVIGEVTWTRPGTRDAFGRSTDFTLRVTDVLRGPSVRTLEIRDLAFLDCHDHLLAAANGERIALAIDAHGFTPPITFATIAWIRSASRVEPAYRITEAEVVALLDRTPDTGTLPADSAVPGPVTPAWPPLALAALIGLLAWHRQAPASRPSRRVAPLLACVVLAGCAAGPAERWTPPAASVPRVDASADPASIPVASGPPTLAPEVNATPPPLNEVERWIQTALARIGLEASRAEGSPHDRASIWVDLGADRVLSIVTVPVRGAPPDWRVTGVRQLAGVELRTVRNDGGIESEWIACGLALVNASGDVPGTDLTLDAFLARLVPALDCR